VRVLHVRLPDRLDRELRDRADAEHTTVSALVRDAIETRVGVERRSIEEILADEIEIDWADALKTSLG
jgi:hypothetical protein